MDYRWAAWLMQRASSRAGGYELRLRMRGSPAERRKRFHYDRAEVELLGTARDGAILCRATPVHRGRTTHVWDATVTVEAGGTRIAQFRCTQMILWPK